MQDEPPRFPVRFVVYVLIGAAILAAAGIVTNAARIRMAELQKFLALRQAFHDQWQQQRPLPDPLVGFDFKPELSNVDLRLSASREPFPSDDFVTRMIQHGDVLLTERRISLMVNFDPQTVNEPVEKDSQTLVDELHDAIAAGIPQGFVPHVVKAPKVPETPDQNVAEAVSRTMVYLSPEKQIAVVISVRCNAEERFLRTLGNYFASYPEHLTLESVVAKHNATMPLDANTVKDGDTAEASE